jgi:hypothetical protein
VSEKPEYINPDLVDEPPARTLKDKVIFVLDETVAAVAGICLFCGGAVFGGYALIDFAKNQWTGRPGQAEGIMLSFVLIYVLLRYGLGNVVIPPREWDAASQDFEDDVRGLVLRVKLARALKRDASIEKNS